MIQVSTISSQKNKRGTKWNIRQIQTNDRHVGYFHSFVSRCSYLPDDPPFSFLFSETRSAIINDGVTKQFSRRLFFGGSNWPLWSTRGQWMTIDSRSWFNYAVRWMSIVVDRQTFACRDAPLPTNVLIPAAKRIPHWQQAARRFGPVPLSVCLMCSRLIGSKAPKRPDWTEMPPKCQRNNWPTSFTASQFLAD